jgi:hypothetical protein
MTTAQNQGSSEIEDPVLTISNVRQSIKKLKNNNNPGTDLIQTELVKLKIHSHTMNLVAESG